jgi:glycosyltransferase involved in cell wall biosynthesis
MIKTSVKTATTRILSSLRSLPREYPDWASFLRADSARWQSARAAAKNGPKVLIANSAGVDRAVTIVDSLLAVALTLRGANVHILLCDEALPACWMPLRDQIPPDQFAKSGPSEHLCSQCFLTGYKLFHSLGLPIYRYSDFLSRNDMEEAANLASTVSIAGIDKFEWDGIAIGENALAGALRFFACGSLESEPDAEPVLRRYLQGSLLTTHVMRRLLRSHSFTRVSAVHGIYVPEGLIGAVARQEGVPFVSWGPTYRKHSFIFSHDDTYHHTFLKEPINHWENLPWTPEMEADIVDYLKSRWYGARDWIGYVVDPLEDIPSIASELGVDFSKPCVGLLTNVIWDAQVHYGGNAFPNMLDWTLQTIKYFATRPDLQLIVRIHPAEIRQIPRSRQLMTDEIKRAFPTLPKNVFIIPPESSISTYATMQKCNAVIIYGTKTGVELTSAGVPVIVAGEAWIRNKGLTLDASSAQEYYEILDRLPLKERLDAATLQRARQYAYHFFFRRMIPLPFLVPTSGPSPYELKISGIDDLSPGRSPGLDVICNGIVNGDEFIYPAELHPENVAETGKFSAVPPKASMNRNEKPLISVIIPTYNRASSLREALDSVYAQAGVGSEFEMEVVVVDDASSDNTPEVVSQYKASRYIRLEKNAGPSVARNVGIKASKGKYVAFLDDDDLWLSHRLKAHLPILENYSEFGAVYGQYISTGFGKDTLWPDGGTAPGGWVFKEFLMREFVYPSFIMVRREAFEKAGYFDEQLRTMEHYDMFVRLAFFVRFAFVTGPVAVGRFSRDGLWFSSIQRGHYQEEVPYIINRAISLLPNSSETAALRREATKSWFEELAHWIDNPQKAELLRSCVLNSLKENPWMITDPVIRDSTLHYASRTAFYASKASATLNIRAVREFCRDVRDTQREHRNGLGLQRFLGDMLTSAARQMWAEGAFKAAGYAASYAVLQDPAQVTKQLRAVSRRAVRAMLGSYGN